MIPFLRIYPPGHPFGLKRLWLWQVCSMNDIEMSGTSDDERDCFDTASTALQSVREQQAGVDN